jgi:formylglycine-generating enzyme required for sulfatase activity
VPGEFALSAGRHTVAIDTERHLDYATEVQVEGLGKLQTIEPKLTPAWARVAISSEPSGAEVRIGGATQGRTPYATELMAGSHRVELRMEGFKPWVSDIQVVANEPLTIGPVGLGLPDGRLVVRSMPSGASVTIGGAYRGRTPLEVDVRPGLEQAIAVSRDGYAPATRSATVAAGGRSVVEFELEPILGEVIVRANPPDAELFVDGAPRGTANQTLRLPSTAHTIEIRKPGYAPHRATVTPRPGLAQNLEVTLLEGVAPAPVAAAASSASAGGAAPAAVVGLTPTLRTKAGQELKLVPAGEFTMGSPRREAGRRANEAQRAVRFERRFYVALREVTNAEFRQFRPAHRSGFILQTTLDLDGQPAVNVTWQDAAAYCNWLSQQEGLAPAYESRGGKLAPVSPATNGYRLPTEAEWEWIARGAGGALRKYPWGDTLPVPPGTGNLADRRAQPLVTTFLEDLDDGYAGAAPVGSFAPNPAGFFDLAGNVAEWTHDVYTVQPATTAVVTDPAASGDGALRVIRGSSWKHSAVTELRVAFRDYGDGKRNDLGFRIARYAQ